MFNVLIVSSSKTALDYLYKLVNNRYASNIFTATSSNEAKRLASANDYDIVIINCPLSDEFGNELALNIANDSYAGIIMLVQNNVADEVSNNVSSSGIMVASKPIEKSFLQQILRLIEATHNRIINLKRANLKLKIEINEIKLIDRAKYILIQNLKMSENQAHKYIEKRAMDMRMRKKDVAEDILRTYEQ